MGCNDPLSTAVREGLALNKVEQETYDAIREPVEKCGFEIVAVEYVKKPDGMNLTIYIDIPRGVTLNDCELVHNTINPIIDELDPVDGPYILNVSSPGLDRPFKTQRDFERNYGREVEIKLYAPIKGKKYYEGILKSRTENVVVLEIDGADVSFETNRIALARPSVHFS